MFRPRGHFSNREKQQLLRRARWTTMGAFAIATCMHWVSGCASTGDARFADAIIESDQTLPEMGSGPDSVEGHRVVIAAEDSDAFRPEPLSDLPATGRANKFAFNNAPKAEAPKLTEGKHDAAIMDLEAPLPSDAAPMLFPSGKSALAMKVDEEQSRQDDAKRATAMADNDRLLAEATASLMKKAPAKEKPVHVAKVKRSHRATKHYAHARRHAKRHLRLAAHKPKIAPIAPIERWQPTVPPLVASTETKALPTAPNRSLASAPAAVPEVPKYLAAAATPVKAPVTTADTKKQPKLASAEIGSAFSRHLGALMMGLGVLVLLCLFFLSKSRRENEPMDW